jgi:TPR repeat protein
VIAILWDKQYNLGNMYREGRGVEKNEAETIKWYRMAADNGDASAQYNLGVAYATGMGVPENTAEAEKWFNMAAKNGHEMSKEVLEEIKARKAQAAGKDK